MRRRLSAVLPKYEILRTEAIFGCAKNAKANTVTTIFTTKAHVEIELSAPENAQMGAAAQAYSAFSL